MRTADPIEVLRWLVQFFSLPLEEKLAYGAGGIPRGPAECKPMFGFSRPPLEEIAASYSDFMPFIDRIENIDATAVLPLALKLRDDLEKLFFGHGSLPWTEEGLSQMPEWLDVRSDAEKLLAALGWATAVPSITFSEFVLCTGD